MAVIPSPVCADYTLEQKVGARSVARLVIVLRQNRRQRASAHLKRGARHLCFEDERVKHQETEGGWGRGRRFGRPTPPLSPRGCDGLGATGQCFSFPSSGPRRPRLSPRGRCLLPRSRDRPGSGSGDRGRRGDRSDRRRLSGAGGGRDPGTEEEAQDRSGEVVGGSSASKRFRKKNTEVASRPEKSTQKTHNAKRPGGPVSPPNATNPPSAGRPPSNVLPVAVLFAAAVVSIPSRSPRPTSHHISVCKATAGV